VWSGKDVNACKGNRLPHESSWQLLSVLRTEGTAGIGAHPQCAWSCGVVVVPEKQGGALPRAILSLQRAFERQW
jgi:hypothetical protein